MIDRTYPLEQVVDALIRRREPRERQSPRDPARSRSPLGRLRPYVPTAPTGDLEAFGHLALVGRERSEDLALLTLGTFAASSERASSAATSSELLGGDVEVAVGLLESEHRSSRPRRRELERSTRALHTTGSA